MAYSDSSTVAIHLKSAIIGSILASEQTLINGYCLWGVTVKWRAGGHGLLLGADDLIREQRSYSYQAEDLFVDVYCTADEALSRQ